MQPAVLKHSASLFEYNLVWVLVRSPVRHQPMIPEMSAATGISDAPPSTCEKSHEQSAIGSAEIKSEIETFTTHSAHDLPLLTKSSFFRVHFQCPGSSDTGRQPQHVGAYRRSQ